MSDAVLGYRVENSGRRDESSPNAPLLPNSAVSYAAPSQRNIYDVRIPVEEEENQNALMQPFCSKYLFLFFLGMFICPAFHVCGMLGLAERERHKVWAGKASAVACIVVCAFLTLTIIIVITVRIAFPEVFDDDDDGKWFDD